MRAQRVALAATALFAIAVPTAPACIKVGVYQENPAKTLPPLQKQLGKGISLVSTYITAGTGLDPKLVALANERKLTVLVTWLPDGGKDGANQPRFRLSNIAKGKLDPDLKLLARQLRSLKKAPIFRPMPDMNTPWYAWSGTVNGNKPSQYAKAWKHVRGVVRKHGGDRVRFLWTPYARSVPESGDNALRAYFPGTKSIDLVGADAHNFGAVRGLTWTEPTGLFASAYETIQALAPKAGFYIGDTGSTASGGDKAAWIRSLSTLSKTLPRLKGVVWFDARDAAGDFRIAKSVQTRKAFKELLKGSCK